MAGIPTLFLTFANSEEAPLANLRREDNELYQRLQQGMKEQRYIIHRESYATLDTIAHHLTEYRGQVILFHYGGHAESTKLILEDREATSEGIAGLLAQQENLKLVFLNGCSTLPQVKKLLEQGIPAVIATSVPINDETATVFAGQFYHSLASGADIRQSFETASAKVQAMNGPGAQFYRKADFEGEERPADSIPWGLYYQDEEALAWVLPEKHQYRLLVEGASDRYNTSQIPINQQLTQTLFDALSPYSEELDFFQYKAAKGEKVDQRLLRRAIMDTLPAPVGEQIRKLFAADPDTYDSELDTISEERLHQIVKTYNSLVELLAFVMLSQLWDTLALKEDLRLSEESRTAIGNYLQIKPEALPLFDYIELISHIRRFFDEKEVPYFIEELQQLRRIFYEDPEFQLAHQFMNELKKELVENPQGIPKAEVESFCLQAEEHLGNIFKKLGFCAKYQFLTIKDIDIIKPRMKPAKFRHYKVPLDTITAGYLDAEATYSTFTDYKSVLLLKSSDNVESFVNLSPFVIDENALKNEKKSKLFYFSHFDSARKTFIYRFVNDDKDDLEVSPDQFPEIYEQFMAFQKKVLGNETLNS
jgi:hypothetical protein